MARAGDRTLSQSLTLLSLSLSASGVAAAGRRFGTTNFQRRPSPSEACSMTSQLRRQRDSMCPIPRTLCARILVHTRPTLVVLAWRICVAMIETNSTFGCARFHNTRHGQRSTAVWHLGCQRSLAHADAANAAYSQRTHIVNASSPGWYCLGGTQPLLMPPRGAP